MFKWVVANIILISAFNAHAELCLPNIAKQFFELFRRSTQTKEPRFLTRFNPVPEKLVPMINSKPAGTYQIHMRAKGPMNIPLRDVYARVLKIEVDESLPRDVQEILLRPTRRTKAEVKLLEETLKGSDPYRLVYERHYTLDGKPHTSVGRVALSDLFSTVDLYTGQPVVMNRIALKATNPSNLKSLEPGSIYSVRFLYEGGVEHLYGKFVKIEEGKLHIKKLVLAGDGTAQNPNVYADVQIPIEKLQGNVSKLESHIPMSSKEASEFVRKPLALKKAYPDRGVELVDLSREQRSIVTAPYFNHSFEAGTPTLSEVYTGRKMKVTSINRVQGVVQDMDKDYLYMVDTKKNTVKIPRSDLKNIYVDDMDSYVNYKQRYKDIGLTLADRRVVVEFGGYAVGKTRTVEGHFMRGARIHGEDVVLLLDERGGLKSLPLKDIQRLEVFGGTQNRLYHPAISLAMKPDIEELRPPRKTHRTRYQSRGRDFQDALSYDYGRVGLGFYFSPEKMITDKTPRFGVGFGKVRALDQQKLLELVLPHLRENEIAHRVWKNAEAFARRKGTDESFIEIYVHDPNQLSSVKQKLKQKLRRLGYYTPDIILK